MPARFPFLLGPLLAALLIAAPAHAQGADTLAVPVDSLGVVADTLVVPADTLLAPTDSLAVVPIDTVATVGFPRRAQPQPRGDGEGLDQPITFAARDSLVIVFADEGDTDGDLGTLFGEANVDYDDATLTASEIDLLFGREELRARGVPSDTGLVGQPSFVRGSESLTGREVAYNLSTGRGRIVGARTVIEDGYLLGGVVKQASERVVYAEDATYTTCELDHPHYGLRAGEMKIVDQEWVYTGPARLYLLGIPTPLWLPFGFFPAAEGRRSGPLPPTYGEDPDLGFYLRDLGWYWAISDYMDLQLRGALWSKGSFEVSPFYRYTKRYAYSGSLDLGYARLRRGESQDPTASVQTNVKIGWTHQQQLGPSASLNGNVNLASTGYLRAISDDFNDRVTQTTQSSIRFQKSWRGSGRSLSADLRQSQNLSSGRADLTFPSLSFRQSERFPLRRAGSSAVTQRWYERVSYSYSGTLQNTYSFAPDTSLAGSDGVSWLDGIFSYDDYRAATGDATRFTTNASHVVPVSASFALTRFPFTEAPFTLNLTPNVRYEEDWYTRTERVLTDDDGVAVYDSLGRIQRFNDDGFTAIRQVTAGVSASSEFYGTFPVRVGPLDGLRHVVRPSLGFSYSPDYSGGLFDYFESYTDSTGAVIEYPLVSGISARETRALSFRVSNVFQSRLARTDSTGEVQRRPLQLLTVDVASNYDLAADSLRLAPFNVTARTQVANLLNLNLGARYSPYAVNEAGRDIDRLYYKETGLPLRFLSMNLTATTSLRSGRSGERPTVSPRRSVPVYPDLLDDGTGLRPYDYRRRDLAYVDFAIPWSLSFDFNYRLDRNSDQSIRRTATLGTRFDFSLTPNWKVAGTSGYDFEEKEITTTSLSVLRDLHCWEMSFNWIPFGTYKSFGFSIYVKSGQLRDLLRFDVPKQDVRNRYGLAGL
ncbi:MAG: putative LPS assembly protein LptD [Rhodothermales bacterium]